MASTLSLVRRNHLQCTDNVDCITAVHLFSKAGYYIKVGKSESRVFFRFPTLKNRLGYYTSGQRNVVCNKMWWVQCPNPIPFMPAFTRWTESFTEGEQ